MHEVTQKFYGIPGAKDSFGKSTLIYNSNIEVKAKTKDF